MKRDEIYNAFDALGPDAAASERMGETVKMISRERGTAERGIKQAKFGSGLRITRWAGICAGMALMTAVFVLFFVWKPDFSSTVDASAAPEMHPGTERETPIDVSDIRQIRGLEAFSFTYDDGDIQADRMAVHTLDDAFYFFDKSSIDLTVSIAVVYVLETTLSGGEQSALAQVLFSVGDDILPDGEDAIGITQRLAGGCMGTERSNLVRKGGVYVLSLVKGTAEENYSVFGDLDGLFEVDGQGLIQSHSRWAGLNQYDGRTLTALWGVIETLYKKDPLRSGLAREMYRAKDLSPIIHGIVRDITYGTGQYFGDVMTVEVVNTLYGSDVHGEPSQSKRFLEIDVKQVDEFMIDGEYIFSCGIGNVVHSQAIMAVRLDENGRLEPIGSEKDGGWYRFSIGMTFEEFQTALREICEFYGLTEWLRETEAIPDSGLVGHILRDDAKILYGKVTRVDESGSVAYESFLNLEMTETLYGQPTGLITGIHTNTAESFALGEWYVFAVLDKDSGPQSFVQAASVSREGRITPMQTTEDVEEAFFEEYTEIEQLREAIRATCEQYGAEAPQIPEYRTIYTADLLHNGTTQTIELDTSRSETDWRYYLRVVDESGVVLWIGEASTAHVGWSSLFLVRVDGKDYLMQYDPYANTGGYSWRYRVFSLNPDRTENVLDDELKIDFYDGDPNTINREEIHAFVDRVNGYFETASLLLTTDEHVIQNIVEHGGEPEILEESEYDGYKYVYAIASAEDSPVPYHETFYISYSMEIGRDATIDEIIDGLIESATQSRDSAIASGAKERDE